jgi:hypothetical protein
VHPVAIVASMTEPPYVVAMWTVIVILLIIWLALSVLGFILEGLFWLAVVGIILFIATAIVGWVRGRIDKS